MRRELFDKVSELQRDIQTSVAQFVPISEMNLRLETKADKSALQ